MINQHYDKHVHICCIEQSFYSCLYNTQIENYEEEKISLHVINGFEFIDYETNDRNVFMSLCKVQLQ